MLKALLLTTDLTNLGHSGLIPDRNGVLIIIIRVHHHTGCLASSGGVKRVSLGVCKVVALLRSSRVGVPVVAELAFVSPGSDNPFAILSVHHRVLGAK